MDFVRTEIPEVVLIYPNIYGDDRGFFLETYREDLFSDFGIKTRFVQDNHSGSQQGVLRGLHYQIRKSQGKIIRAIAGEIFDVAVDIRNSSPTFGKWVACILSAKIKQQLWIPEGFAHGFLVLSEWAEIAYKATDYYAPEYEKSILWNDPTLNIAWPLNQGLTPILSEKDRLAKPLREAEWYD